CSDRLEKIATRFSRALTSLSRSSDMQSILTVGHGSPWPGGKPVLLPEFVPVPDAASVFHRDAITELACEHQDLAAMVRLMRKHVGEHRCPGRPGPQPSSRKLRDLALAAGRQSLSDHAKAL